MRLQSLLPTLLLAATSALAQTNWAVTNTFHVGGEGGWDYITADPATHRLFVTRSTHTLVIDAVTGKTLADIPGQRGSHGVAIAPAANRGFITDGGGPGAIVVFDLTTYAILGKLPAAPDADGILFDAAQNRVLAVSGDGGILMSFAPTIDLTTGKPDMIPLGGKPEFFAADGSGKVFINLEDKDLVAVVDLASKKVTSRWPVAPGGSPVGLSIDPKGHHLFIGCRKPQLLVVMSTNDGKIEASIPIGAGVDATAFDHGQAFASCRDGSVSVIGEHKGVFSLDQVIKTALGARTMTVDSSTHKLYLPTADFDAPATAGARPKTRPGTFVLLEVGHK
jgi:DNA-binding beta-propeller fold protein YncE